MTDIFTRVAQLANEGGIPITAEGVKEIDGLLFDERISTMRRKGILEVAADAKQKRGGKGAADADRQGETLTQARSDRTGNEGGR